MASVYALRLFIRAMHNRVGKSDESRELSFSDGLVLVPLIVVIVFMAVYPQLALHRSEGSVKTAVQAAQFDSSKYSGIADFRPPCPPESTQRFEDIRCTESSSEKGPSIELATR
jgi:hypothetical protein